MGFLGVYRALYDYTPQAEGELTIEENDLLYVLEKNADDGWWKAKKKAGANDEDEPVGLVPHNYVEEFPAVGRARALYEYTRQTDEELSFPEDAILEIFDTSDPDWILVGLEEEYGFVPSNYIDMDSGDTASATMSSPAAPALPARPRSVSHEPESPVAASPVAPSGPAAALAGMMHGRSLSQSESPPPQPTRGVSQYEDYHHASDDDPPARSPPLPSRPQPPPESTYDSHVQPEEHQNDSYRAPGGFHMYNVNEMVSVMGKKRKMPTTLGINLRTGMILIAPEKTQDGPSQEWTADKMTHYSREGKHVFMELVRPSKSIDFHAGAKDTADEIVRALGEMAGAVRAEGLKEVIAAGTKKSVRKGQILYDFMAQSEDEVTVAAGDEVIVLDDSKSEEWWQVRRLKNGKEGVVPSSYIEITGTMTPPPVVGVDSARSTVDQNRMEEIRLTKEALRASKEPQVGPGMSLPERGSSLNDSDQQSRRQNGRSDGASKPKSKPDPAKIHTWTDRSKSFSVDAQFLGLRDGKIHLHKLNGVKIAVPLSKMSTEDIEYVESMTGISLKNEKVSAEAKKARPSAAASRENESKAGRDSKPEYDWFQFFLDCNVAVGLCERYAQAFNKDSMDESVLPDVDAGILRNLGLREGDIIKVMRTLDAKYGRQRHKDGEGGLFSGPGGALRNNTRKGRPAPTVQTSDVVDASAFSAKDRPTSTDGEALSPRPASLSPTPTPTPASAPEKKASSPGGGFEDDAWDVKPIRQTVGEAAAKARSPPPPASAASPPPAPLSGSMKDLSLLSEPLQPTLTTAQSQIRAQPTGLSSASPPPVLAPQQQQPPPPQGASPGFFSGLPPTGQNEQGAPQSALRQRPAPPQTSPLGGSLVPQPPQRPLSAPQSAQPSAYNTPGMLAPQMTGLVQGQVAPPGQSLHDMTQARLQQQYTAQMQPNYTGFPGGQAQPMPGYQNGTAAQFMQPMMQGMPQQSPFADPGRAGSFSPIQAQPTGFQPPFQPQPIGFQQQPQAGVNSFLPQPHEPQRTAMPALQPQQTGMSGFGQQTMVPTPQPLQPQQTGPAPPIRFGVSEKKLVPQPTGRKANLSQATPSNPFGF
ncbi:Actin cytoskeleton-regulatory complex protein-like protein [Emericellopsis cladophorae]|uniref:Actin cytoskeleton-regulatory complex protein SLA1 n=1 Tax=Emericellopsis cladophorae TaxID=2686198 RepID=A0A9Q0BBW2_9HYPO|nr:Actin cytoskeleton-regulatory complex protein-like protein [Emericellopsis cladophorae]KAI6779091.1 Actin cytoskeleton-regulatory complex protein-like protein [Emericellopsis cladophorae]